MITFYLSSGCISASWTFRLNVHDYLNYLSTSTRILEHFYLCIKQNSEPSTQ